MGASCVFLAACDVGAPEDNHVSRGFDRPVLSVAGVSVTQSYDAERRPIYGAASEDAILEGATTSASVKITFNRWLLPHKVTRQALCISPTTDPVLNSGECTAQPFAEPAYDPVERSITMRLPLGERLAADTQYKVSLFVTESLEGDGLFAFDGAPLERSYAFDFRTQADNNTAQDELRPLVDQGNDVNPYCISQRCFADCMGDAACETTCRPGCVEPSCYENSDFLRGSPVGALFSSCAFAQCHAPNFLSGDNAAMAMGLDLSSPLGIASTAIERTAHQTQTGQSATLGDLSPRRFGRAMPLIDPGNPGNSYLIYKILSNPLNQLRPGGALDSGVATEIDRLRDSVVVGLPMPAQSGSGGPLGMDGDGTSDPEGRASYVQAQIVSTWIAYGAITSCD